MTALISRDSRLYQRLRLFRNASSRLRGLRSFPQPG